MSDKGQIPPPMGRGGRAARILEAFQFSEQSSATEQTRPGSVGRGIQPAAAPLTAVGRSDRSYRPGALPPKIGSLGRGMPVQPGEGQSVGSGRGILQKLMMEARIGASKPSEIIPGSTSPEQESSPVPQKYSDSSSGAATYKTESTATHRSSLSSTYEGTSGYISHATEPKSDSSSDGRSSVGRGKRLAQFIMQQQAVASQSKPQQERGAVGQGRGQECAEVLQEIKKASKHLAGTASVSSVSSLTHSAAQLSLSSEDEKPVISKQGTSGDRFNASCNWIRVAVDPDKVVYEYEVKFVPAIDAQRLRYTLVKSLQDEIGKIQSFDGAMLWLPHQLPSKVMEFPAHCQHTNEDIKVIITLKRRSSMQKNIHLYNLLFKKVMRSLQLVMVGRNYFSPQQSLLVPQHKLEIWPGFVTAVHHTEGGVMICVDTSHRILRTNTVYDVMDTIWRTHSTNFKEAAKEAIIGSIVLTRYNNRCYRIDDIYFESNVNSTFTTSRGDEQTYVQYYKTHYNIDIADHSQCLLVHRVKKKDQNEMDAKFLCLVPELCHMTGLTDEMRSDFRVMKDIAQHTKLTPTMRQVCLGKFIKRVNDTPEARQILGNWGLVLMDEPIELEGRALKPEAIIFGNKQIDNVQNADWGRESCREKVICPVDLMDNKWAVIYTGRNEQKARNFVDMLQQVTNYMGITVGKPIMENLRSDSIDSYIGAIKKLNCNQLLQLAVIIFPSPRDDRYSAVKRFASGELGLPTQCINVKTISMDQRLRSVSQKIALQVNCKLGGELWALKIPMEGLMVCGVDVYHDPVTKGKSVVGFVASLNRNQTRWFSHTHFNRPGDEVIHGMKIAMLEALRQYYKENNHQLPKSIIIYRDGVADGMLRLTEEHEIPQIRTIFRDNFDMFQPKFYFVVVQKRINTRVFSELSGRGSYENPPPGSIIDHTITKRDWYDFLLVSQFVRQGTVSPTHYVVLHDSGLDVDRMQKLTYKLTHLYYNWPGTIRVPAACQYAHKLAYLVGQNIRKDPHHSLSTRLHFL